MRFEMGAPDGFFSIERRGGLVIVTVGGRLTGASSQRLFADLLREAKAGKGAQVVVYDATRGTGFDMGVIPIAQQTARDIEPHVRALAIVSSQARMRFALSMVQLASKRPIKVFEGLAPALTWASDVVERGLF
jgi:hypothetical protein